MAGLKGFLSRIWHGRDERSLANADQALWDAFVGSNRTLSGINVTPDQAMRLSAVWACVRLISESIGSLPLHVYRRVDMRRRERVNDSPVYRLLHDEPNRLMTSFVFRETLAAHALLWGNAYAVILRTQGGEVAELLPVMSNTVRVRKTASGVAGELVYDLTIDRQLFTLSQWDVVHVPGLAFDGIQGLSPIKYAAQGIGLGLAAEQFGAAFFGNGALPNLVVSLPGSMSQEQAKVFREAWHSVYGGASNSNRTAVLFEGAKVEKLSIPPDEAQFIESRKFQISEIARWYRVPPHMIGDLERATFSNIEHQALEFVTHTLRPWLVRFEQEFNRKLFPTMTDGTPSDLYCEFNVDGLLRGDIKSRADYYVKGRQWGWLSANDIRERENMQPIEGGDVYLTPLNMTTDPGEDDDGEAQEPASSSEAT